MVAFGQSSKNRRTTNTQYNTAAQKNMIEMGSKMAKAKFAASSVVSVILICPFRARADLREEKARIHSYGACRPVDTTELVGQ